MTPPFLTVFTPTYKRPKMLAMCKTSVREQTVPVEHVIMEDKVGLGVGGMYLNIRNHVRRVHGEYVMVLSDDNILTDPEFARDLERKAVSSGADVIMFKGQIGETVQPVAWAQQPIITMVDLSCFAVRRDIWVANADKWGDRYEGDFDFIDSLWRQGFLFCWWDRLVFRALQISRGAAEAA